MYKVKCVQISVYTRKATIDVDGYRGRILLLLMGFFFLQAIIIKHIIIINVCIVYVPTWVNTGVCAYV